MPKKPPRNNPRHGDRRTVQSAAALLRRITERSGGALPALPASGAAASLIQRLRESLAEEVRPHLVEVLEKPGELVLFADSAVWAGRLKLAAADLSGVLAGRRQTVRVMPPGRPRK